METTNTLIELATAPVTAAEKFISRLERDDVFVPNKIVPFSEISSMPTRRGYEQAIVSNNTIVNIVSKQYGHLPNDIFFKEAETRLKQSGVKFAMRSINRENRSFVVDYILHDDSFAIKVKNGNDIILPMIRLTNSYDGSNKTSGHFGFYREVCSNGLHIAKTSDIQFSLKHRGNIVEFVMPEINNLIVNFMENEYYSISKKFEVLAERQITNIEDFVKLTSEQLKLFKFEKSDKNHEPSLNAQTVINIINKESNLLSGGVATLWHGYNAFNEVLHGKLKKTFEAQKTLDAKLFDTILELA